MRTAAIERQRDILARRGLAALVVSSPQNLAFTNGFVIPSQPLMPWRHAFSVVTAEQQRVICVDMEETTVRAHVPEEDLRVWAEFGGEPGVALAEVLGELGCTRGPVGMELDHLPARIHQQLREHLPRLATVGIDAELAAMRQLKNSDEVILLRRLSRISDQAITDGFAAARVGGSEMDIASALTRSVYTQGAQEFRLMIVATGERSQLPNVGPTERVLRLGDVCRVEIFSVIDGYHAGVCRTAVVSEPPPEAERIWSTLVECRYELLDAITPGASTRAVWRRFTQVFDRLGMPAISFVGHGIGVHLHEDPYLGPHCDQELRPGMVLGIEPLVYRTGFGFGMQLKDMVLVTDAGCELLSNVSKTDELPIIG